MFGKTKKVVGVLLASCMIATAFAGCGGGGNTTSSTGGSSGTTSTASGSTEGKSVSVDEMMKDADYAVSSSLSGTYLQTR